MSAVGQSSWSDEQRGIVVIVVGVVMLSLDGAVIRLLDADPWTVLLLRSPTTALSLVAVARMIDRRPLLDQLRAAGRWGLAVTVCSIAANVLWVVAVSNTAVANVLAIYAAAPLFVALLGWLMIGERLARPTWIALFVVTLAVLGLVTSGLEAGGFIGNAAGLGATLTFALALIVMRRSRLTSMLPAMAASHTTVALMAIGPARPSSVSGGEIAIMALYGLLLLGPGIALVTYAPRLIRAGEVGLVLPLETVLGSAFAWVLASEAPTLAAVIGGTVIIATLVVHSRWLLRRPGPGVLVAGEAPG